MNVYANANEPWSERAADRIGHWSTEILCASIFGVILIGLYPPQGALMLTVPLLLVALVIGSWVMMRRHDRRLCELCAATIPLNPGNEAARFSRRFWVAHTGSERRFLIPYIVVLIGSNFFPGTLGRIVWAIVQLSMVYLIMSHTTHRKLQPWCPWCSDGGGGSKHEDAPEPHSPDDRRLLI